MPIQNSTIRAAAAHVVILFVLSACGGSEPLPNREVGAQPQSEGSSSSDDAVPSPSEPTVLIEESVVGTLPDESTLQADTVMAARYAREDAETTLMGVWAVDTAACQLVDQEDQPPVFLVVAPSSLRDGERRCTVSPGAVVEAEPFLATCFSQRASQEQEIVLDLIDGNRLLYGITPNDDPVELVRCGF